MKNIALIFLFIIFSSISDATSPLCDSMTEYSCAPGSVDDGTGKFLSEFEYEEKISGIVKSLTADAVSEMRTIVENRDNAYFNRVAASALGLVNGPTCLNRLESNNCKSAIIEGLASLARRRMLRPLLNQQVSGPRGDLESLDYILQNSLFSGALERLLSKGSEALGEQPEVKKIEESVFPQVKSLMIERLRSLPIKEEKLNRMIEKIQNIAFAGTNCSYSRNENSLDDLLISNARYDILSNSIKLCSGYLLRNTSQFQYVQAIAHEIAHSIDPCFVGFGPPAARIVNYSETDDLGTIENEYPIKNLISCLRRSDSIGASNFQNRGGDSEEPSSGGGLPAPPGYDPSGLRDNVLTGTGNYGGISGGSSDGSPIAKTGRNGYGNIKGRFVASFCGEDQIGESFCDWIAAEIIPKYMSTHFPKLTREQFINGYSNIWRVSCESGNYRPSMGVHPHVSYRIDRTLLVQPDARRQMGCHPNHKSFVYCDPNKPNVRKPIDSGRTSINPGIPGGTDSQEAVR